MEGGVGRGLPSPCTKTVSVHNIKSLVLGGEKRRFFLKDPICRHAPNLWAVICGKQISEGGGVWKGGKSRDAIKCPGCSLVDGQIESIHR